MPGQIQELRQLLLLILIVACSRLLSKVLLGYFDLILFLGGGRNVNMSLGLSIHNDSDIHQILSEKLLLLIVAVELLLSYICDENIWFCIRLGSL